MAEGAEARRLGEARRGVAWKAWGPYLSERQWGTVREDYSENGDAWSYFSHDQARSRSYKWGEDGIAGICDDHQRLCLAFAVWNGVDPILKERMFGLTNSEGNHGEDVKEYYFYLDATPTSSYLKYRYRYPLGEYPYADLLRTNAGRGRSDLEYELLDTGIFDDDRFVDVDVEYAKAAPDDIHVRVTLSNRGAAPADVHLLPTLWFRNTWWMDGPKGVLAAGDAARHHGQSSGARGARAALRRRAATAVHRERDQHGTPVGHAQRHPVRQGRVPPLRRRRPGRRRQPRPDGHQGRRLLPGSPSLAEGAATVGMRLCRPGRQGGRADSGQQGVRRPGRRGRRVLRLHHAAGHARRSGAGHAPGTRRDAVGQAVLLLRPGSLARGAPRPSVARRRPGPTCATAAGSTWSTTT